MDKILSLNEKVQKLKSTSSKIREVISSVLDEMSFVEMGALAFSQNDTFQSTSFDGEGVVTGYGTIDGMPVYLYAENFEVLQGGFGVAQANKIVNIMEMAEKTGAPVLAILDSQGARLGEGVTVLEGYSKVLKKSAELIGYVPQIAVVNGKVFGGVSYITAMSDVTIMIENSQMATCGPMVLSGVTNSNETVDSLIGANTHATVTGLSSMTVKKAELKDAVSKVLDLILCGGEIGDTDNSGNLALNGNLTATEKATAILDAGSIIELHADYLKNAKTFLGRMGGQTVGIVTVDSAICNKMARKISRFVRLLENYSIPLVTLVNSDGIAVGKNYEQDGLIDDVADLAYSIATYEGTKISVICGNAVGMAYSVLASKNMGFDYALAWANGFISTLPAKTGAEIVYADAITGAKDKDQARKDAMIKYAEMEADVFTAGKLGSIDNVIEPSLTRPYVISALAMLR